MLCLILDLRDSLELIEAYEGHHRPGNVWPEVIRSIRKSGVVGMRIFRCGTRLTMIMEVEDSFDPAAKAASDASNRRVVEWERLMETYQDAGDAGDAGEKWRLAKCIFDLSDHTG